MDLINIADEQGKVQIYYKDFVKLVDCSEAQFYNVLKTLEDINIIKRNRNNEYKNEIDIIILENDFYRKVIVIILIPIYYFLRNVYIKR